MLPTRDSGCKGSKNSPTVQGFLLFCRIKSCFLNILTYLNFFYELFFLFNKENGQNFPKYPVLSYIKNKSLRNDYLFRLTISHFQYIQSLRHSLNSFS